MWTPALGHLEEKMKKIIIVGLCLLISANLFGANPKNTKLCNAVQKGKVAAVKKELAAHPEDINKEGERRETPVTKAARIKDSTEILDLLIKAGAKVNSSALNLASNFSNSLYFKYLIQNDIIDANENISYLYFLFSKNKYSFDEIVTNVKDVTCGKLTTPYILKYFDKDQLDKVIETFSINISAPVDKNGTTLLQNAANNFNVDLVEYLIGKIDINQKNNNGINALVYACTAYGPSINWKDTIIENDDTAKINFVSDMPYYRDPKDVQMKQLKIVEMLLDANIEINNQDIYGWTVLHYASAFYPEGLQELLISKGANTNLKTKFGRTADDIKNLK